MERKYKNKILYDFMQQNNLSICAFAKKCGVSTSIVKKLLNCERNLHTLSVYKVCVYTDLSIDAVTGHKTKK